MPAEARRLPNWIPQRVLTALTHVLIVLVSFSGFYGTYYYSLFKARKQVIEWSSRLYPQQLGLDPTLTIMRGSAEERGRLSEQYRSVISLAEWHLSRTGDYMAFAYASVSTTEVAAALAALALFWIAKVGFPAAAPSLLTFFAVCTVAAIAFQSYTSIGKHTENISAHSAAYSGLVGLAQDMRSYSATGQDRDGKDIGPPKYIHFVDNETSRLNNITIAYDPTKIPEFKVSVPK